MPWVKEAGSSLSSVSDKRVETTFLPHRLDDDGNPAQHNNGGIKAFADKPAWGSAGAHTLSLGHSFSLALALTPSLPPFLSLFSLSH